MRWVTGFFRFWYDFIVGDDWRIAVMVVVALVIGAVLLRGGALEPGTIAVLSGLLIVTGLFLSLARELRRANR